jgi:cell division protein FtsL
MSRSAAARTAPERDPRLRRSASAPVARRVSGPAYNTRELDPRPRAPRHPRPLRAVSGGGAALALRVTGLAVNVSGSRAMDRLVRSRGWIFIVGFGLIGIVAMQVSLLKLNAGIGRAMQASATLERGNAQLRLDVSKLSSTDRIQRLAAERGFAMPAPGDVGYLQVGDLNRDGRLAARAMRAPDPETAPAAPTSAQATRLPPDSAVVTSAPGAAPNADAPVTQADGRPATGGAGTTAPAPPAQTGGVAPSGAPASGGVVPPTQVATPGQ